MSGPLTGIRVLDLSAMLSGPWAADILGDQGAEVIKVETPGVGDHVRALRNQVEGLSSMFVNINRSKRSLTLNLKDPEGIAILKRLVERADDNHRLLRSQPTAVPHRVPGGEFLHGQNGTAHPGGDTAQVIGHGVEHDPAPVHHQDPLKQPGGLVDQVRGQQHGPRVLGVLGEQAIVEQLARYGVQARVRLVEHRHLGPCRQADHYPERRPHPPGQLLDRAVRGQREVRQQGVGEFAAPRRAWK